MQIARCQRGQLLTEARTTLVCHERIGVGQLLGLRGDGVDDALVAMADVHRHQLAVPVEVALAVRRVEVRALGGLDRDGVDGVLGHPLEHGVLLRERHDLFSTHRSVGIVGHFVSSYHGARRSWMWVSAGRTAQRRARPPECAMDARNDVAGHHVPGTSSAADVDEDLRLVERLLAARPPGRDLEAEAAVAD